MREAVSCQNETTDLESDGSLGLGFPGAATVGFWSENQHYRGGNIALQAAGPCQLAGQTP